MKKNVCKICRRVGQKLFLKGEKCFSTKCVFVRRPYPPGPKSKKRKRGLSEYGKELIEKQKMRSFYGLSERQFKNYVKAIIKNRGKTEDTALELVKKLEKRLDNVVFRMGLASSRSEARQIVNHGHFLLNGKPVDVPSCEVKKNDIISIKEHKKDKAFFKKAKEILKRKEAPHWLKIDSERISAEVIDDPKIDDSGAPAEISAIFEYYSR